MPSHMTAEHRRGLWRGVLSLLAAMMLLPATALAQGLGPILNATQATDESMGILSSVIGPFWANPLTTVGGATTVLGGLFMVFNTAIFLVALVWGSWNVGRAVISTATDGEVLGARLSGTWMPVRMTIGVVGLVPVFGGFNLGQVIFVTVAAVGIGIANLMMQASLTLTAGFIPSLATAPTPGVPHRSAVYSLFAVEVCARARQEEQAMAVASNAPVAARDQIRVIPVGTFANRPIAYTAYGTDREPAMCGGVYLYPKPVPASMLPGFRTADVDYQGVRTAVQAGYGTAFAQMQGNVQQLAQDWFSARQQAQRTPGMPTPPVPVDALDRVAVQYGQAVLAAAASAARANASSSDISNQINTQLREWGWSGLGAYYATYSEANTAITDAINSVSVQERMPDMKETSLMAETLAALSSGVRAAEATTSTGERTGTLDASMRWVGETLGISSATGNWSVGQAILRGITNSMGANGTHNPIIAFKNLGDFLMVMGQSMHAANAVFNAVGLRSATNAAQSATDGAASKGPGFFARLGLGVASAALNVLPAVASMMIIIGLIMSIYIPMVPFITWMGGLVQYMVIVIEGMAAMTLALLAHMEAEGEGLGQRTEPGYIFLLNVLARPGLMVMGFFAATALLVAIGTFQINLFMAAVGNVQGDSMTGLLSIVGFLVVLLVLNWVLIQGLFNMIFLLADNVIGFIGANHSVDIGKETEGKMYGMVFATARGLDGGFSAKLGKSLAQTAPGAGKK